MTVSYLKDEDITDLTNDILLPNGKLKFLPAEYYHNLDQNKLRLFCHLKARYGIPTIELIDFLKDQIKDRKAIEIGAGNGDFAYHLNIPATDAKYQADEKFKNFYKMVQQPVIQYPQDVIPLTAQEAVYKYKPKVVIASWVTEKYIKGKSTGFIKGVNEIKLLKSIETYILIGNIAVHGNKEIMKIPHKEYCFPWIISRSNNPELNRIWIWNKNETL
jgi:hypothetical protein